MGFLLHSHPLHRQRQLRWVVPLVVLLALATLATLAVQYQVSDQAVGTEFFKAHKTIAHTGELLRRGTIVGSVLLLLLLVGVALWALRLTHRIVRPVHTLHQALDALVAGDLGVRVELHEGDEFHEVGVALNQLVDEFGSTLARVHALVDGIAGHAAAAPADRAIGSEVPGLVRELDQVMDFFRLEPRRTIREDGT